MANQIRILLTLDGKQYSADLQKAEQSTKDFGASTAGTGTQAAVLASRLAAVGVVVGSAYVAAMLKGTAIAGEHQRQLLRLEGQIKATGGAAGKMAEDLDQASQLLSRGTLFSDESIREAQGRLLTFTSITGTNFDRALDLAADLAAVMGTDIPNAAVQLGKALEDPADGLGALSKAGIKFSEDEEKVIKALEKTGQHGAALVAVLDAVESKVGGVAQREAEGYAGSMHRVGESWEDFLETLEQTDTMQYWLNAFDSLLRKSRQLIAPTEAEQAGKLFKERYSLEQQNSKLGPTHPNVTANTLRLAEIDAELAQIRAERNARLARQQVGLSREVIVELAREKDARTALTEAEKISTKAADERYQAQAQQSAAADDIIQREQDRNALLNEEVRLGRSLTQTEQQLLALRRGAITELTPAQQEQLRLILEQNAALERQVVDFQNLDQVGNEAVKDINVRLDQMLRNIHDITSSLVEAAFAGENMGDALASALQRIAAQLAAEQLQTFLLYLGRQAMFAYYKAGYAGNFGAPIDSPVGHTGGIIGGDSLPTRSVHPAVFAGARRLHGGGLAGGEVPAILQRGEGVFTREQMRSLAPASSGTVNVYYSIDARNATPEILPALMREIQASEGRVRQAVREDFQRGRYS